MKLQAIERMREQAEAREKLVDLRFRAFEKTGAFPHDNKDKISFIRDYLWHHDRAEKKLLSSTKNLPPGSRRVYTKLGEEGSFAHALGNATGLPLVGIDFEAPQGNVALIFEDADHHYKGQGPYLLVFLDWDKNEVSRLQGSHKWGGVEYEDEGESFPEHRGKVLMEDTLLLSIREEDPGGQEPRDEEAQFRGFLGERVVAAWQAPTALAGLWVYHILLSHGRVLTLERFQDQIIPGYYDELGEISQVVRACSSLVVTKEK